MFKVLYIYIYIYIYSTIKWRLKLGQAVIINLFRRRILLVYSPSHQMTLLHALYCPRDANEELQFIFRR